MVSNVEQGIHVQLFNFIWHTANPSSHESTLERISFNFYDFVLFKKKQERQKAWLRLDEQLIRLVKYSTQVRILHLYRPI